MPRLKSLLGGAAAFAMVALAPAAMAQEEQSMSPAMPKIMSLRDQAQLRDAWLERRFETVLPQLMRENGIDMWVLIAREYLEDPVVSTMLNATNLRARRRTILIFFDPGNGKPIERLVVSKHGMGDLYTPVWDMEKQPDQFARVRELIAERNPKKIALNISSLTAFGDGLTHSQYTDLTKALTPEQQGRIVSGYPLAIGWLETRTPEEMKVYPEIVRVAHAIIGEGFSSAVVKPGVTTNEDLVWWYRQRVADLGLGSWFHPSVEVTRKGVPGVLREKASVIQKGDMLRVDFGINYLNFMTDTQHVAYVLRDGETDAPAGLKAGLRDNNRVQDAVTSEFRVGATGNEVLNRARAKAIAAGLKPTIYSHPIGYHGHGAGSSIGLSEEQKFVPTGEYKLRPNIAWSIELMATKAVPEWGGQMVDFKSEEDAFFDGKTVRYIDGRQTKFHLIGDR
ncbi:M24 family metallopeptidase [Sphingomonas dokdonensis]|uniref:Metallopeptidase family M24 n=1 Tax=Sphingomonas dokdonensis TaxID=344880 RepID=A0A245ZIC7_9SPHN|nr:M24 family metallopeptidase [Sphingomonas dokdonensis]OWK29500.1 metallopeptidase family M24 [Sphingomonas dokdonensis]